MVTSASLPLVETHKLFPLHYALRQSIYILIGLLLAWGMSYVPMRFWEKRQTLALALSFFGLSILLIPGVSRPVNGSTRWLHLGPVAVQPSEFAKLGLILYLSGFLVRYQREVVEAWSGFFRPLLIVGLFGMLLLLEPDFGATVVATSTALGLLFVAGVPLHRFLVLLLGVASCLAIASVASPYRIGRLLSFLDPWSDQFNTGYQLTQALIAFGRGGLLGAGLGCSVQKLLYLPEPHTDFLFAVLAEELGLVGALTVLVLFAGLIHRIFGVAKRAKAQQQFFSAYLVKAIGFIFALQAMVNLGVNMGVLPTKGLTLPFVSFGGSSVCMAFIALGWVLRADFEARRGALANQGYYHGPLIERLRVVPNG